MLPLNYVINKRSTIDRFFNYLNKKSIFYVWLHGYNNEYLGDIDISINDKQFKDIDIVIKEFASKTNFKLLQILQHEYAANYFVLGKITKKNIEYLIPDICSDYVRDGRILLKAEQLLENRRFNGKYYYCQPSVEAVYIFLKRSLKQSWESHHLHDFKQHYEHNRFDVENKLTQYLFPKIYKQFFECIERNYLNSLNQLAPTLRKSILLKTWLVSPFQHFRYHMQNLIRLVKRIRYPTGLVIAVLGTDGSGKSTVIEELTKVLSPAFRRHQYYHFKPTNHHNQNVSPVTEPHKAPPRNKIVAFGKLLYYTWQYIAGYWGRVFPQKIKSTLVFFDRYYYDLLVDQRRFRMNLPPLFIKLFLPVIPKPDLILFLHTKPEIAISRKGELSINELERQQNEFLKLKKLYGDRFVIIENNNTVDEAVNKITRTVFSFMERRCLKR